MKIDGGISQNELIRPMKLENELGQERIRKYERGILIPPLHAIVAYSDVANIFVELIIKDDLDLPATLPKICLIFEAMKEERQKCSFLVLFQI